MYGFFLRNDIYGATYGFARFNTSNLQEATFTMRYDLLSGIEGNKGIFAGACVNDIYYAYEYDYTPYGPIAKDFAEYNLVTNKRTPLASYQLVKDGALMSIQDMTYNYKLNKMYALCFDRGLSIINEVNLKTGAFTQVCELAEAGVATIAADNNGDMYTIGQNGVLYRIDLSNGAMTSILDTGRSGMLQLQTMEFDHSNNMLYWPSCTVSYDSGEETYLLRIDIENKTVEDLGLLGQASCLLSLYIPYAEGGDNAPGKVTDINVVAAEQGVLKADLSWTNPTTTFINEELTSINEVVVERDGVEIAVLDNVKPGQKMTMTDNTITKDGEYRYIIYARNDKGNGYKSVYYAYVGVDTPVAPEKSDVVIGPFCKSAEITWEVSTKGLHDGYLDPEEITYKIIRLPDSVVIADNLKETKFVDNNITTLQRYCYKLYACNRMGETGAYTQLAYVLGDPYVLPYKETFENLDATFNTSTYVDGNGDFCSWAFNSPAGYYQFGDSQFCLEYIVNPGFEHSHQDADEWMITPPFNFEAGKNYKISFEARSIRDENIELTIGDRNVKEFQTKFAELTAVGNTDANFQEFHTYEVDIPAGTSGVNCIGLRLVTPYPSDNYAHLQFMNIMVQEGVSNGIDDVNADAEVSIVSNKVFTGSAEAVVEVYDVSGMQVLTAVGSMVSLENLKPGMYIVKVRTNGNNVSKKYMVR